MRDYLSYAKGLEQIATATVAEERRTLWRQGITALARAASEGVVGGLEGTSPELLKASVQTALKTGLFEDLNWLGASQVVSALYELAAAIPAGVEQREVARRLLGLVRDGNAEVFAVAASRFARGSWRVLANPDMRARVALTVELPLSLGVPVAPMALAMLSRAEVAREWVEIASTRSLASRRMAARLIEHAAREAATRAEQGDIHALGVFEEKGVEEAMTRLLADREPLVWKYVAAARGLLMPWTAHGQVQVEAGLAEAAGPTGWRRAAVSVAAYSAVAPTSAASLARQVLAWREMDPGVVGALIWGLPRAFEAEPEIAAKLLEKVMSIGEASLMAEPINDALADVGACAKLEEAGVEIARRVRSEGASSADDVAQALLMDLCADLETQGEGSLRAEVRDGLTVFASEGAAAAYIRTLPVLDKVAAAVDALASVPTEDEAAPGRSGAMSRRTTSTVLRDVEVSLTQRTVLENLLALSNVAERARESEERLDGVREALANWIVSREGGAGPSVVPGAAMLHLQRLRALLRLADADLCEDEGRDGDKAVLSERASKQRTRWVRISKALIARLSGAPPPVLRRTLLAALARVVDALARSRAVEVSEALLVLACHVQEVSDFRVLAEASMDPDLVVAYRAYAEWLHATLQVAPEATHLGALKRFIEQAFKPGVGRSDALVQALQNLLASSTAIAEARALRQLSSSGGAECESVHALEQALASLQQLCGSARLRFDATSGLSMPPPGMPVSASIARVLSGLENSLDGAFLERTTAEMVARLPRAVRVLVQEVVVRVTTLPLETTGEDTGHFRLPQPLPAWLPARRTLGGYYVIKTLGSGAVGSVFLATRVEERHDPNAERFALKVPVYSESAARSISEGEFMDLFRAEATALLGIPKHKNLARFVTFDIGAKPKPILVMEHVQGSTLERLIETRRATMGRIFQVLLGVLEGLAAMHQAGVGHLDIKPSNIILRVGTTDPVIVDFGLAGRNVRPGCATVPYGAPEVWGVMPAKTYATPAAVDLYAFACLAFECLTGELLFDGDNEAQILEKHANHDGYPSRLARMRQVPSLRNLADLIACALRADPRARPTAKAMHAALADLAPRFEGHTWPVAT